MGDRKIWKWKWEEKVHEWNEQRNIGLKSGNRYCWEVEEYTRNNSDYCGENNRIHRKIWTLRIIQNKKKQNV